MKSCNFCATNKWGIVDRVIITRSNISLHISVKDKRLNKAYLFIYMSVILRVYRKIQEPSTAPT